MSKSDYWYAVQVRSGREIELVGEIEDALSIGAAYCPTFKTQQKPSRHSRKFETVELPLFNKYLFVKFGSPFQNWSKVTLLRDVDGFVRANGFPLPIRPSDIAKIRNECETGSFNDAGLSGTLSIGDKVEIDMNVIGVRESGYFSFGGHSGTFQGLARSHMAKVELSIFGRETKVEIPTELLARIL